MPLHVVYETAYRQQVQNRGQRVWWPG